MVLFVYAIRWKAFIRWCLGYLLQLPSRSRSIGLYLFYYVLRFPQHYPFNQIAYTYFIILDKLFSSWLFVEILCENRIWIYACDGENIDVYGRLLDSVCWFTDFSSFETSFTFLRPCSVDYICIWEYFNNGTNS